MWESRERPGCSTLAILLDLVKLEACFGHRPDELGYSYHG